MNKDRTSIIKTASIIALIGNLLLAGLKIFAGLFSGSLAVLGDGIDSSMDVLIAIMSLLVARVISKPADKSHPWGHGRAETVVTSLLSMILFFAGGQLVLHSGQHLIEGTREQVPSLIALVATLVSISGKIFLAWTQYHLGKEANSAMLKANGKNMAADVLTSVGVLIGIGCSMLFNIGAIDLITAILVGLWVIKNAVSIFLETNVELMDGSQNNECYKLLFEAVHSVLGAEHPHRARMRRIAIFWDIDLDIEVDRSLTIAQAHEIATKVENAVKERIDHVFDIMIHIEPAGNKQVEGYGLSEKSL